MFYVVVDEDNVVTSFGKATTPEPPAGFYVNQRPTVGHVYLGKNASGQEFGELWRQPSGAHDAYPLGTVVAHGGDLWKSLRDANPDEPGVASWRPASMRWVQPTGGHDAYPLGECVRWLEADGGDNGRYENTGSAANVWSPGVFGWTKLGEG